MSWLLPKNSEIVVSSSSNEGFVNLFGKCAVTCDICRRAEGGKGDVLQLDAMLKGLKVCWIRVMGSVVAQQGRQFSGPQPVQLVSI